MYSILKRYLKLADSLQFDRHAPEWNNKFLIELAIFERTLCKFEIYLPIGIYFQPFLLQNPLRELMGGNQLILIFYNERFHNT